MSLAFSQLGARQKESDIARLMTVALERPELLSLAAGFTDNQTLPLAELTEVAIALRDDGDRTVLQYGANQGNPKLRGIMTERLCVQDGGDRQYDTASAFITNGSQQALYLAVQTLCDPGDIVLVEKPTYFVFLEMLRGLGVEAVSLPMLEEGDVDAVAFERMLKQYETSGEIRRVKAVYLVSYFSNPSGHSISKGCKEGIMQALEPYQGSIALFEDAAYRDLYCQDAFPAESCLSISLETRSQVPIFYTTTLTKPFATGLKVGLGYCTHSDWLARMLAIKGQQDFGTANYNQALLAKSLESGVFDRHLELLRRSYLDKMETLDAELSVGLAGLGWTWVRPKGGLYIWLKAPVNVETGFESAFHEAAIEAGVMYVPGELCHAERDPRNRVRLSFGVLGREDLKTAGRRFCGAAAKFASAQISSNRY